MGSEYSLKELYDVLIKPTYDIEVNGKTFTKDEVVVAFDKIQISNFNEVNKVVTAHGGYGDENHVWWETIEDVKINFVQGIFSNEQLAILSNARLTSKQAGQPFVLTQRIQAQADENGEFTFSQPPVDYVFVYDKDGNKITDYTVITNTKIGNLKIYGEYIIDYGYLYDNGYSIVTIGSQLTNGYFSLQAKTRVKDDITGKVRTGVLIIPKLKLMSGLSMRLGENATPITEQLNGLALPTGSRGNKTVMELVFLNDDIDSDI